MSYLLLQLHPLLKIKLEIRFVHKQYCGRWQCRTARGVRQYYGPRPDPPLDYRAARLEISFIFISFIPRISLLEILRVYGKPE